MARSLGAMLLAASAVVLGLIAAPKAEANVIGVDLGVDFMKVRLKSWDVGYPGSGGGQSSSILLFGGADADVRGACGRPVFHDDCHANSDMGLPGQPSMYIGHEGQPLAMIV